MREVTFIKQNADRWRRFEQLLKDRSGEADDLADLFVQLTDDLAYAQTFYPKSKTVFYLNNLTGQVHRTIYRNRKEESGRLKRFWLQELPALCYGARRELLVSFVIFFSAMLIGAVSTANDDTFVRLIMGDRYVNMTLQNIENEDPMAVYKQANEVDMFLGITLNNVRVSFLVFAAGIAISFGTGYVLFINGVMLGSFFTFFATQGLFWTSMKTVWIHGALEISAIVIAGGAGIVLGNSILFPDSYSRLESFKRGARRGMKIVVGIVPIFIVAGFLEGFVTRYTEMPLALTIAIIGGSLVFVTWYFILYPRRFKPALEPWNQLSSLQKDETSATS